MSDYFPNAVIASRLAHIAYKTQADDKSLEDVVRKEFATSPITDEQVRKRAQYLATLNSIEPGKLKVGQDIYLSVSDFWLGYKKGATPPLAVQDMIALRDDAKARLAEYKKKMSQNPRLLNDRRNRRLIILSLYESWCLTVQIDQLIFQGADYLLSAKFEDKFTLPKQSPEASTDHKR